MDCNIVYIKMLWRSKILIEYGWNILLVFSMAQCNTLGTPTRGQLMFPDTSSDATLKQLQPYHAQLREIFSKAVKKFNQIEPTLLLPLMRWDRSRAICIWAYAMEELSLAFPPGSEVQLIEKYGTLEVHFGPNLVARLKKMSANGFTSNYATRRIREFHSADQGELFVLNWAKPLRIDIGYRLNDTSTGVEEVMVARRKSLGIMDWFYHITTPDNATSFPLAHPAAETSTEPGVRIEARQLPENQQQESTGTENE